MKGIDFKAIVTKAAGNAAGAAAFTQLNKIAFIKNQTNPKIKGAIIAGIGYLALPYFLSKAKMGGKGKADFANYFSDGVGMIGTMILGNAFVPGTATNPGLFPTISGYEESPVSGLGMITEEDYESNVSGYETPEDVVS